MSPSEKHERVGRFLCNVVVEYARTLDIEIEDYGSATFKNREVESGVQPDGAFYVRNVENLTGKFSTEAAVTHSVPDLVIEIDVSSPSTEKFDAYRRLRVKELWHHGGGKFTMYGLENDGYVSLAESRVLPGVSRSLVESLLVQFETSTMRRTLNRFSRELLKG